MKINKNKYNQYSLIDRIKFLFKNLDMSVILPMLAKDYKKEYKKIDWTNAYIQPKLDGMRCLAIIKNGNITLKSRDGKDIMLSHNNSMQYIYDDLKQIGVDIILDGELYAHGQTFQENMSLIKKYKKGETELIKYHVYDVVKDRSFNERSTILHELSDIYFFNHLEFVIYNQHKVISEEEIKEFHSFNLFNGYEGSIIRWGDEPYKVNGRSSHLLKYKDFLDITAEIINIEPANQRPTWGRPICKSLETNHGILKGAVFASNTKMSHAERIDLLANKNNYIGKTAEIRFFESTDSGLPRFPVMVGIRLDK